MIAIVVPADFPTEGTGRQRTVLSVAGAALQRDLLPDLEKRGRGRRLDGRLGWSVARENLDRGRGRDRPAGVPHPQRDRERARRNRRVGVTGGRGGSLPRCGPIPEIPLVA